MAKLIIEFNENGRWVKHPTEFKRLQVAATYANGRYPNNEWRVVDQITNEVLRNSVAPEIAADMRSDLDRFAETDRWRERFRAQREQRDTQRQRDAALRRQQALQGWQFTTPPPTGFTRSQAEAEVLALRLAQDLLLQNSLSGHTTDGWTDVRFNFGDDENFVAEKVDWIHEGF